MATPRATPMKRAMELDSNPSLAKSSKRHPIKRSSRTKRTEKKNHPHEILARLSTLEELAASNKTKLAENEAKWEKPEDTNLDHSKKIDSLEYENDALKDELSQFREDAEKIAEKTLST